MESKVYHQAWRVLARAERGAKFTEVLGPHGSGKTTLAGVLYSLLFRMPKKGPFGYFLYDDGYNMVTQAAEVFLPRGSRENLPYLYTPDEIRLLHPQDGIRPFIFIDDSPLNNLKVNLGSDVWKSLIDANAYIVLATSSKLKNHPLMRFSSISSIILI